MVALKVISLKISRPDLWSSPAEMQAYFTTLDKAENPIDRPLTEYMSKYLNLMHMVWMGASFSTCLDTYGPLIARLSQMLPDREIMMWTDAATYTDPKMLSWAKSQHIRLIPIDAVFDSAHPMFNQRLFDYEDRIVETNYARKADMLRYEILYRFGGIYLDEDVNPNNIYVTEDDEIGNHPLFSTQRRFGYTRELLQVGDKLIAAVSNNDMMSAVEPGMPEYRRLIQAVADAAQLPYDQLKQMNKKTRSTMPAYAKGGTLFNKYEFWSTQMTTGPALVTRAMPVTDPKDYLYKREEKTARAWVKSIETRYANWHPATDIESDQMVTRIIESTRRRLFRNRLDLTRYTFLLERCRVTPKYGNPFASVETAILAHLKSNLGRYRIKYVFANSCASYERLWKWVDRTQSAAELGKGANRCLFKALKRSVKQQDGELMDYLISKWTRDMWLTKRERETGSAQPVFTRAYRLLNAAGTLQEITPWSKIEGLINASLADIEGDTSNEAEALRRSLMNGRKEFYTS